MPQSLSQFLSDLLGVPPNEPKVTSMGQDIVYACGVGKFKTPKHIALDTTARHWTCSKRLTLLDALGHCSSYSDALRVDTRQANDILEDFQNVGAFVSGEIP